jgi:hypothetical protein
MKTFLDIQHKMPTYSVYGIVVKEGINVNVHFETSAMNDALAETSAKVVLKGFSNEIKLIKVIKK